MDILNKHRLVSAILSNSQDFPHDTIPILSRQLHFKGIPGGRKPGKQDLMSVDKAIWALEMISAGVAKMGSQKHLLDGLLKLWPNIWKWLQFLHSCCVLDTAIYGIERAMQTIKIIPFVLGGFGCFEELRKAVTGTPGVIAMVTNSWVMEGRSSNNCPAELQALINADRPFTNSLELLNSDSSLNSEIITLTDGRADEVARIAMQHLQDVLCQPALDFGRIGIHVSLLHHFQSTTSLLLSLQRHKAITVVIKVLKTCNSQPSAFDSVDVCARQCYIFLITAMSSVNSVVHVVQAIEAGLITAMVNSGRRVARFDPPIRLLCVELLSKDLCQFLVYRTVLKALKGIESMKIDEAKAGPLWQPWLAFKTMALERIAIKSEFDMDSRLRPCCRVECDTTGDVDNLKRCAACHGAQYCSRNCQRLDWPRHKPICRSAVYELEEGRHVPFSTLDGKFMFYLLLDDMERNAKAVTDLIDMYLWEHPLTSLSSLAIQFDYQQIPRKIVVVPSESLKLEDGGENSGWADFVRRASESKGEFIAGRAKMRHDSDFSLMMVLLPTAKIWQEGLGLTTYTT